MSPDPGTLARALAGFPRTRGDEPWARRRVFQDH